MRNLYPEFTKEKMAEIASDPYFAPCIEYVKAKAEEYLTTPPPRVSFSAIHEYAVSGDRAPSESINRNYHSRLTVMYFMYRWTGEKKYLDELCEVLWNILDWESWTTAPHMSEEFSIERRYTFLDLTSTILGANIAEILYFVGEDMPELIYRRAKEQLRKRIIDSYAKNFDYWWMRTTLNWAAVCTGNILTAYLFMAEPNEISEQLPRMLHSLELYISGFDDEGCCLEGYGYWNYGFSHYCRAAKHLYDYTEGKINLFDNPKVHKVALFQQNAAINETQEIPFSDCSGTPFKFSPLVGLSHFLKSIYPDVEIPPLKAPSTFLGDIMTLLWLNPALSKSEMNPKSTVYKDAQWFIFRSKPYNFVCKAGSNNEPHNHNDIGSFAISKNGAITFTDAGGGLYTRQYFDPKTRYSHLHTSSRGHNVPIIDGEYQVVGKQKSTLRIAEEQEFAFNMENGYAIENLKSLDRHVLCEEDGVTVTDTYVFDKAPKSVVERFVTYHEPKIEPGRIGAGGSTLIFDADAFDVSVSSEKVIGKGSKTEHTVYLVDLSVKALCEDMAFAFKFV